MSRFVKAIGIVSIFMMMTGCASMNDIIGSVYNPHNGNPEYYHTPQKSADNNESHLTNEPDSHLVEESYITSAEKILSASAEKIRMVYEKEYAHAYPNSDLNIQYKESSDGVVLNMKWESPKAFFDMGRYDIVATKTFNGREPVSFIDLLARSLVDIVGQLDDAGLTGKYKIIATLAGQADATPVTGNLIYLGEYGNQILLTEKNTTLNGVPHTLELIKKHRSISNEQLAGLRAYSLAQYLRGSLYGIPIDEYYNLTVAKKRGLSFRSAGVKISIEETQ
ncbi:hypothetical protein [Desulfobacter latus]|uniref:Lipoprotein n=1 Tax=Desulfobacter latus TaxID=2292 RepID=A0A850SZX5_9BACT|nr:hypothetical protein [Desulfobacter latus]NWH04993.1 hypothetical protein [Desulfobacter latus]